MNFNTTIDESLFKLMEYIEKEKYKGFDPYDALSSPIFDVPFLKENFFLRFGIQQLLKRSPINLRPLLKINKGLNPVTLGLCIRAYSCMGEAGLMSKDDTIRKCESLITQLKTLIPKGYNGACWGYDFPWQSRHFKANSYDPSIVATGIITDGLFQYFKYCGSSNASELCISAASFVLNNLNRIPGKNDSFCFSYTSNDHYPVFNANMKGVRLLAQAFNISGDNSFALVACSAIKYTMEHQNSDGSWEYAPGKKGKWIDNYHTGYILECAKAFSELVKKSIYNSQIETGFQFYEKHFILNDQLPKFYSNRLYPIDSTAAAQSIITLLRFGRTQKALNVAGYMITEMQSPKGYFYFRKHKYYLQNQSFMRWSNAWMLAALSELTVPMSKKTS